MQTLLVIYQPRSTIRVPDDQNSISSNVHLLVQQHKRSYLEVQFSSVIFTSDTTVGITVGIFYYDRFISTMNC